MRVLISTIVLIAALTAACGGGGSGGAAGGEPPSAAAPTQASPASQMISSVAKAISKPGMVFHAQADNGVELWIDTEKELARRQSGTEGTSSFGISIGQGLAFTAYDPETNGVKTQQLQLPPELERAEHVSVVWFEPLNLMLRAKEPKLLDDRVIAGRSVATIEVANPTGGQIFPEGSVQIARIEVDRETLLVAAYETQIVVPDGVDKEQFGDRLNPVRVTYQLAEIVPRESLPTSLFSPDEARKGIISVRQKLEDVKKLGLEPYWLGESHETSQGKLTLGNATDISINGEKGRVSIHYTLTGGQGRLDDAVVVTLQPRGAEFEQPALGWLAGKKPEQRTDLPGPGIGAVLLTSLLKPGSAPCPVQTCAPSDVPLYRRLVTTMGSTAVEIVAMAGVDPANGKDANPFNTPEAISGLASSLVLAQ